MSENKSTRQLSYFALVMITIMAVIGLRNLPLLAMLRGYYIYFLIFGAIVFLFPLAWVSAELSSIWSEKGDVYLWVKKAFGPRIGFLAIWFKWVQTLMLYPLLLSFLAGTLAYIVAPYSADNKYYIVASIWIFFSGATYLTYYGVKVSAWFTIYCTAVGVILPLVGLFILAIIWLAKGFGIHSHPFPHVSWVHISNPHTLVGLCIVFLSYSGIEIAASCVGKSSKRQRLIPKVLFVGCLLTVLMLILGTLACAFVLPMHNAHAVTGLMESVENYFAAFHLIWLTPVLALFMVLGVVGSLGNWLLTASNGLQHAAKDGGLPSGLQRENKHGAPSSILILQVMAVFLISCVFLYMPNTSGAFWLLSILALQMYLMSYLFLFAAAIKLRYKFPFAQPKVRVWGGNLGMWFVAGIGFISSLLVLILSFFTPYGVIIHSYFTYYFTIITSLVLFVVPGILIVLLRKPHWKLYADVKALSRY